MPLRPCQRYLAAAGLAGAVVLAAAQPPAQALRGARALRGIAAQTGALDAGRVPIAGSHPAWATAANLVSRGPAVSGPLTARVYLAGRDPRGLAAFAAAVSTPASPDYRHFLSHAQAQARFGPGPGQVSAVSAWLHAAGMTVTGISDDGVAGAYAQVRGSVTAAARAFGVTFGWYRGPDGQIYRAPAQTASAPRPAGTAVLAVSGLSTEPELMVPAAVPGGLPVRRQRTGPCSRTFGSWVAAQQPRAYGRHWPWAGCGYLPRQLRKAYQVTASGLSGRGQTVAIVDAYRSAGLLADADRFARRAGDAPFGPGQYRQYRSGAFIHGRQCHRQGWQLEQVLDTEAVHGLAPAAGVRYVGAASCHNDDMAEALADIVNRHLASIVTGSWGSPEQSHTLSDLYETIFEAGAAEGIGFYFSSGDHGYNAPGEDPGSKHRQVGFPAASPWVTAVGGTSLALGARGQYRWERTWGDLTDPVAAGGRSWRYQPPGRYPGGFAGGGGGGVSMSFRQPAYQRGVVPRSIATRLPDGRRAAAPMRVVPDVAAVANQVTGMLTGRTQKHVFLLSVVGGTSLACPVFAAIMADAQQGAGHALGFANPALYARAGTHAFHDITGQPSGPAHMSLVHRYFKHPATHTGRRVVTLFAIDIDGRGASALTAARGYDDATGLGSPWLLIKSLRH